MWKCKTIKSVMHLGFIFPLDFSIFSVFIQDCEQKKFLASLHTWISYFNYYEGKFHPIKCNEDTGGLWEERSSSTLSSTIPARWGCMVSKSLYQLQYSDHHSVIILSANAWLLYNWYKPGTTDREIVTIKLCVTTALVLVFCGWRHNAHFLTFLIWFRENSVFEVCIDMIWYDILFNCNWVDTRWQ